MTIEKQTRKPRMSTKTMAVTSLMIALTVVMALSPVGTIRLPVVSITISHLPILITAVVFGLLPGLAVALAFGVTMLLLALTAPTGILDPFFVNPLISILPRLLIPVTTYFVYQGLMRLFGKSKKGEIASTAVAAALGNLTNTFGVYTMLYLVYAREILEQTGSDAVNLILTAISATTLVKCAGIMLIAVPVVMGIKRALKFH
jgi:uncharacterized membrane protein